MLLISTLVSSEINLPPYLPTLLPTLLPSLPKKPYPFFETRTHSYLLDFDLSMDYASAQQKRNPNNVSVIFRVPFQEKRHPDTIGIHPEL